MTFFRGNIGEILALALTATLLWLVERAAQHRTWHTSWMILCWIALLLAHNITAVYASGVILLYGAIRAAQTTHWRATLRQLLICFGLAMAGALWFWLPALAEKHLIVLDRAGSINEYARHFATLTQLFLSPVQFGFSYPGAVDTLGLGLGLLTWLTLLVASTVLVVVQLTRRTQRPLLSVPDWLGWIVLACFGFIFIQTSASYWLWELITPLKYAQFPWRFGMFVVLLVAPIAGWLLEQRRWHWLIKALLLVGLATQIKTAVLLKAVDYFHKAPVDYDAFSQTTSTQNENRTPAFRFESVPDWQPTATVLSGEGQITTSIWRGSQREYSVEAKTKMTVVEPTMLFAGWQTTANNQPVSYLTTDETLGRLAYQLEPGTYQIKSRFTQFTWPRIIGNTVSVITLSWLGWQVLRRWLTRKHA